MNLQQFQILFHLLLKSLHLQQFQILFIPSPANITPSSASVNPLQSPANITPSSAITNHLPSPVEIPPSSAMTNPLPSSVNIPPSSAITNPSPQAPPQPPPPPPFSSGKAHLKAKSKKAPEKTTYQVLEEIQREKWEPKNWAENPFPPPDPRAIVIEFSRPYNDPWNGQASQEFQDLLTTLDNRMRQIFTQIFELRNGAVVDFSPVASACLASNTAAYFLGGYENCKGVLFYLVKYLSKDQIALILCITVLKYAIEKISKYPQTLLMPGLQNAPADII